MKTLTLLVALLLLSLRTAAAIPLTTITIDLGAPSHDPWSPRANEIRSYSFDALNGTVLAGQTLSLDIVFDLQQWQFTSFRYFDFTLVLGTDVGGYISDWSGTYHGIGASGQPVNGGAYRLEFASDDSGNLIARMVGWDTTDAVYRAHLDLVLPNMTDHQITSGRMDQQGHPMPEPGSLVLLVAGIGAVWFGRRHARPAERR